MEVAEKPMEEDFLKFIHTEPDGLKPQMLFMNPLKWKYLIRNILRGKNIMMTSLVVVKQWPAYQFH